jgi:hypothetical protein
LRSIGAGIAASWRRIPLIEAPVKGLKDLELAWHMVQSVKSGPDIGISSPGYAIYKGEPTSTNSK